MEKMNSATTIMIYVFLAVLAINTHTVECSSRSSYETVRNIRFYVQDISGGNNATVWMVAQSNITNTFATSFGTISVTDTLLTAAPELNSEVVGRIQGVVTFTDMNQTAITVLVNLVFTNGEYNGSTLTLVGRNALNEDVREVSVVAGTGVFRFARGYALTRTYAVHDQNYTVNQFDVVVLVPRGI